MKTTLLIMAAGIGSRFGTGIKQLEPVDDAGHIIMDYKDTFKMYTDMFLTEYIILAIHLNSQGALPDMVLNKVKENANLMV